VTIAGELFAGRYRVGAPQNDFAFVDSVEALDEKLHRKVIITTVKDRFASNAAFVDKFTEHARAGLHVVHPALARTYDVDTDPLTGTVYMVTELVAGQSLHDRLKQGALDTSTAAGLFKQVALGLEYARTRGLHHLGVSPRKIWITPAGRAVVSGLSMSALASQTAPTADFLASASNTSGYLAPEQILSQATGEATDVYALGLCLSEALCARPTWDRGLRGEALTLRASSRPVLPGAAIESVPAELDELIAAATEPDVVARTITLSSIAARLEVLIAPTVDIVEPELPPTEAIEIAPTTGINPTIAKLFPASSLSEKPFTLSEFTAGRDPRGFATLLGFLVGIVVAFAIAILVVVSLLPANFIPVTTRAVPGVIGYTFDDAAKAIDNIGLVPVKTEEANASVEAGKVISVSPSVGTKLEIGAKVTLSVSLGAQSNAIPNVVGMTLAAAKTLITQAGFTVGTVVEVPIATSVKGTVVATLPAAGEAAVAGTVINISQASGKVAIPNLVGKTVTEATQILRGPQIGISPSLVGDRTCASTSPSTVKSQSAGPGEVASNTKITLTYCTGN
jgi:beta-lactam-binding protein with PASTA domain